MEERLYQICTRCVMDTTDPQISFNENGECDLCTEYIDKRKHHNYQGKKSDIACNNLISDIKKSGTGKKYDCIIGLSGGVDSSTVAWITKQKGLRVLAIHIDNGWNSEEAEINIKNVANKLNIDYQKIAPEWNEFRELQLTFLKASIPEAETPTDVAIPAILHKVAAQYGAKYIISGGNFATEGILPKSWHYNAKDLKYFNYIVYKFGPLKLKSFPTFGFLKEFYYKVFKGIKTIYLLNYVPYNKSTSKEMLKNELDWRDYGGKHHESKYTAFIQSYYLFEKFGIDYRRATFSAQICTGELKREQALQLLETKPYNKEKVDLDIIYIAEKLEITVAEMNSIINAAPKWYWNYPNSEKKLSFIYNTYRKLYKKEKLANF